MGVEVKRVAAALSKYQICETRAESEQQIAPELLGWHKKNRDGLRASASRLEQLTETICGCFDKQEACHDAVCVRVASKDYEEAQEHNKKIAGGDEAFADLVVQVMYYTLGHTRRS